MTNLGSRAALIRHAVYRGFADRGAAPSAAELAADSTLDVPAVLEVLRQLPDAHALVLNRSGDAVRMAHPFSAAPMGYLVFATGKSPVTGYPDRATDAGRRRAPALAGAPLVGRRRPDLHPHSDVLLRRAPGALGSGPRAARRSLGTARTTLAARAPVVRRPA